MKLYIFNYSAGYGEQDLVVITANSLEEAQALFSNHLYQKSRTYSVQIGTHPNCTYEQRTHTYGDYFIQETKKWLEQNEEKWLRKPGSNRETAIKARLRLEVMERKEPMYWYKPESVFNIPKEPNVLGEIAAIE